MDRIMKVPKVSFVNKRLEKRIIVDSINLPFLGSREDDYVCFEYLILDISINGMQIAIPKWVVNRELMKENDLINFHIPFQFNKNFFNQGKIVWTRWDETRQAQICGAHFGKKSPCTYPIFISFETSEISINLQDFSSENGLLFKVMKDSLLLKKGVSIYLNHLIPYFSRITKYPRKDYPMLKELILNDIRNKVKDHYRQLEMIYEKIVKELRLQAEVPEFINLEELRSLVESEIYIEIFKAAFEFDYIRPYLLAIKELGKKLYYNYNVIVMIYTQSLK